MGKPPDKALDLSGNYLQPPKSGGVMHGVGVIVGVLVLVGGPGCVAVGVRVGVAVFGDGLVGLGVLVDDEGVLVGGDGVSVSGGFGVRVWVGVNVAVCWGVGDGVEVDGNGPLGG